MMRSQLDRIYRKCEIKVHLVEPIKLKVTRFTLSNFKNFKIIAQQFYAHLRIPKSKLNLFSKNSPDTTDKPSKLHRLTQNQVITFFMFSSQTFFSPPLRLLYTYIYIHLSTIFLQLISFNFATKLIPSMAYIKKIIQDVTFEIYFESTHIDSRDAITNQLAIVNIHVLTFAFAGFLLHFKDIIFVFTLVISVRFFFCY